MEIPQFFTLKQVAQSLQKTIADRYKSSYWVLAEVHKINLTKKGHCYPELVYKENELIVAQMRGTIWKTNFEKIQHKFSEKVKEPLRDGMQLLLLVNIVYHPLYDVGLDILDIDTNYTIGALHQERQETLIRLQNEGVLNKNQLLTMPFLPKRIAIISQADSKGYSDFITLLNGHPKRYHFDTFLFEATLQGDSAVSSIKLQLDRISKLKSLFDVVVIIRGGGGEIGMHCYNNYDLAFAIATFPLPVLSGIGHSTNLTVSEMVSYYNGITPTDLAYYFLKIMEGLDESICTLQDRIASSTRSVFENSLVALIHSSEIVYRTINQCFQMETLRLNTFDKLLQSKTKHSIEIKNMRLSNLQQFLPIWTENNISFVKQQLIESSKDLSSCINDKLKQNEQKLDRFALHIQLVDPKNVLKKGYAIVSNSQGVLSTSNSPVKGDKVHVLLQNQEFDARVE